MDLRRAGSLPSVGQVSLVNSNREVNCVTVSDSGAVMAVGMATCVVKVFILAKSQMDVVDIDTVIRRQVQENIKGTAVPEEKEPAKGRKKMAARNAGATNESKEKPAAPTDAKAQKKSIMSEVLQDREEYELIGHEGPVFAVSVSICDKHLLSASFDRTIRRWSLQTKGPLMVY